MLNWSRSRLLSTVGRLVLLTLVLGIATTSARAASPNRPAPPADLRAVAASIAEIDLAWTAPRTSVAIAQYVILRDGVELARVGSNLLSYPDLTVQPATRYRYSVAAVDSTGARSPESRTVEVRTPAPPERRDTTAPSEPEGLSVTQVAGAMLLDWYPATDDSDLSAYVIRRDGRELAVVDGATLSYRDTTAEPGVTHTYTVEALDVAGHHSHAAGPGDDHGQGDQETAASTSAPAASAAPAAAEPAAAAAAQDPAFTAAPMTVAAAALAVAPTLRRYPYLTDVISDGGVGRATVNWATDRSATTGSVKWGQVDQTTGACTPSATVSATKTAFSVNTVPEYQWKAQLGLAPDTQYCYRVFLATTDLLGSDPSPRFWTQVPAGATTPYSFAVFGDWGMVDSTGSNPDQANLMSQIASSGVRFAVTIGDNAYPSGTHDNYGDLVQTGANLSAVFGPQFWTVPGRSIPLFTAMGNHGLASTAAVHPQLLTWPQDRAVATSSGRYQLDTYCCLNGTASATYPSIWYAFDAGPARFYVLDAAWADGNVGTSTMYANDHDYHWLTSSPEWTWLQADLQAHSNTLKFAFFHYPLHSDNATEPSDPFLQGPSPALEGLLGDNGVQLAFDGHSHLYQRNLSSGGVVSYVAGGGGAKLEPQAGKGCTAIDAYGIGWSYSANGGLGAGSACGAAPVPTSLAQVFHFLKVTVKGTTVTVTPTDSLGHTFDVKAYAFGDTVPPSAPTGLNASAAAPNQVNLTWTAATDNVGVTGYDVLRGGTLLRSVGNQTAYADTTVAPSTTYTYTVRARDAAGNVSASSNSASVLTPPANPIPPPAPTNLAATPGNGQVSLSWTAASGATGYTVKRSMTSGGPYTQVGTSTTTSFVDTTVTNGVTSFHVVTATNSAGESGNSNEASATPSAPTGGGVTLVTQTDAQSTAAVTSLTVNVPATTAGNTLVVIASLYTGATKSIGSISDSSGTTWNTAEKVAGATSGANGRVEIWWHEGIPAGITGVTLSQPVGQAAISKWAVKVIELHGVAAAAALDTSATAANAATTTLVSGLSPAVSTSGEFVVAAVATSGTTAPLTQAQGASSPTAGWVALTDVGTGTTSTDVLGRAAYLPSTTAGGQYQAAWSTTASKSGGGAVIVLKSG